MATRNGPIAQGTDGMDFTHREKVASHYQISSLNKTRLRKCIFMHLILSLIMVAKLVPEILDKLDIFIIELEELEVPQPLKWEYVWVFGALCSIIGLFAVKRNRIRLLQIYFVLINLFSTVPVAFALMFYFSDFLSICSGNNLKNVTLWQGYPVAALWYAFLIVATQVHIFTLLFTHKLILAWKGTTAKKST